MGLRTLRPIIPLVIIFIWAASGAAHGQDNAVGGSVHTRNGDVPLAGVTVTVVQQPTINDMTRDKDAVYLLPVPVSLKRFHLKYDHPEFLKAADEDIPNDQRKNKRPIVMMRSNKTADIGNLSPEELQQIVADARRFQLIGITEEMPALADVGTSNLNTLLNASIVLRGEARKASAADDVERAHTRYLAAASIQAIIGSREEAQTLNDHAEMWERRGDSARARTLRMRAAEIRKQYDDPSPNQEDAVLYGITVDECQQILLKHGDELRRHLIFVGDKEIKEAVARCKDDSCLEAIKRFVCSRGK